MILTRYLAARRYATTLLFVAICISAGQAQQSSTPRFEVTLPAGHKQPVTGRVFVVVARSDNPEPRLQAGSWRGRAEFMGVDVQQLQPGQSVSLTSSTLAGSSPHRYQVGEADQDPEYPADKVVGTTNLSGCNRAPARRL